MITIKGFHGPVPKDMAQKMDAMADIVTPNFVWQFAGTIGEFADKWQLPFLAYTNEIGQYDQIYITKYTSFGQR